MAKRKEPNILELRGDRWFENGRWLPKKDYIYHASANEGPSIISGITNQLYRLRNFDGKVVCR